MQFFQAHIGHSKDKPNSGPENTSESLKHPRNTKYALKPQ